MQQPNKKRVAYRLSTDLLKEIKQFQQEQRVKPTQIGVIEAALREFFQRQREAKRSSRR